MKTKTVCFSTPPLSWDAVRNGAIYCAPACGGRCTWAAYQKAVRGANALAKRLGTSWVTRVWENLGWHYSAIDRSGYWKVSPNIYYRTNGKAIRKDYTAFFGLTREVMSGSWYAHGRTPEAAIAATQEAFYLASRDMTLLLRANAALLKSMASR